MSKGYPYKRARLIIPGPDAKDQRWKIRFSAWDVAAEKLVTRTLVGINSMAFDSAAEKKAYGEQQVAEINKLLRSGYVIGQEEKEKPEAAPPAPPVTIGDAVGQFLHEKKIHRASTQHAYQVTLSRFVAFVGIGRSLTAITGQNLNDYLLHLKVNCGLASRTHNNHRNSLRTFFAWAVKRYQLPANPSADTKALPHSPGKNTAYTRPQQRLLLDYMRAKVPHFHHLCLWMYYTLIRTNELAQLQVADLDRPQAGMVYLKKEITKNGHSRAPKLPADLEALIVARGLRDYPPEYFIFSEGIVPGPDPYPAHYIAKWYRYHVLKPLKFGGEYTLYSWKHTGVCELYRAGVPRWEIILQAGWRDSGSFEAYLHSLGLFDEKKIITSFPKPGQ